MKKPQRKTDCWIWAYSKNGNGYGVICRGKKVVDAHKFLFELLVRKVPHGTELDHLCKNKLCVNPTHLEPVSHAENCRRGKQTKLTPKNVKWIRKMSSVMTQQKIADKFGVSRASIGYILQGKRWI